MSDLDGKVLTSVRTSLSDVHIESGSLDEFDKVCIKVANGVVESIGKLTEQNKMLREALAEMIEATEMLNFESGYMSKSIRNAEDLLDKIDAES